MRSWLAVALLLQSLPAMGAEPLEELRSQLAALNYAQARKTLDEVRKLEALSRAETVEFFTIEGLVKAALNDAAGARAAFTRALLLEPTLKLPGKPSPRVMTPFLEAKSWVGARGPLTLVAASTRSPGGDGWELTCAPVADELGLVSEVLFAVDEDGVRRSASALPKETGRLSGRGQNVRVGWRLRSARQWVLAEGAVELEAPTGAPVPPPSVAAAPGNVPLGAASAPASGGIPKALSITTLIVGASVVSTGLLFLLSASGAASRARQATTWAALEDATDDGRRYQTISAVLLGTGAAVAIAGTVMLVVKPGSSDAPRVAFVPTPGGGVAVFSGVFP